MVPFRSNLRDTSTKDLLPLVISNLFQALESESAENYLKVTIEHILSIDI